MLQLLQKIGFTEKEAQIYLTVLEFNEAIPSTVARRTGIKRANTYQILENLEKRGMLSHVKREGSLFFQAVKPELFIESERKKQEEMKSSLDTLATALPELSSLHLFPNTPQMAVFKGKSGIIQIMEDTLTTKTELLCWANPEIVFHLLKDYYPSYIEKKVSRKIWLKGIFCYDPIGLHFKNRSKEELREVYLIPKEEYPFKNEINIYDDKVAIISHEDEIGVIIQNQNIANTQRAIFNLGFKYAKLLDKT